MNINARKYGRKQARSIKQEAKGAEELQGYLKAARLARKGRYPGPEGAPDLSKQGEIDVLEAYAMDLEDQYREFIEIWPDKAGLHAAQRFLSERGNVLDLIVRLKVQLAKGE